MSNLNKAVEVLRETYRETSMSPVHACEIMANALQVAGLLKPDAHIIRTQKELEALAREDADAIVLAGEAGVVRTVKALCELRQLVYGWGLPAVVIASGRQVRAAREAMEKEHE